MYLTILLLLFVSLGGFSHAAPYALFERVGTHVTAHKNYEEIISNLKPGKQVRFSDGKTYSIASDLKHGNTTAIFSIKENPARVIRIPLGVGVARLMENKAGLTYSDYHRLFVEGYEALAEFGVPVTQMHDHLSGEYAEVDALPATAVPLTVALENKRYWPVFVEALKDFSRRAAAFTYIADFDISQMALDVEGKRILLFDWTRSHSSFLRRNYDQSTKSHFSHIFSRDVFYVWGPRGNDHRYEARHEKYNWLVDLLLETEIIIGAERKVLLQDPSLKSRIQRVFKSEEFVTVECTTILTAFSTLHGVPYPL